MTFDEKTVDERPVWHLVAEVLPGSQVRTMCGLTVDRADGNPGDPGDRCAGCEGDR